MAISPSKSTEPDIISESHLPILALDRGLQPYEPHLRRRRQRYNEALADILTRFGSLADASGGLEYFGFNRGQDDGVPGIWYREWAPGADALYLIGDFNAWDRAATPLETDERGVWQVFLPDSHQAQAIPEGSRVKVHIRRNGNGMDRIPAYIRQVEKEGKANYHGVVLTEIPYKWRHSAPSLFQAPRVYEAHVGMAQEKEGVGTFDDFREYVLPRIKKQGYNCIQLMGIQQHPYYASFGYHVSSFYAVSDYFGTPQQLKQLIDAAHGLGLRVFMDIVHSHSVKNVGDGLNMFDGTDHLYFHPGNRGNHPGWDSKVFNYGRPEVIRFLLSNIRYWLEEFHFDGFRFDGISSMIYLDHGFMRSFNGYEDFFDDKALDHDGMAYLQLANTLVKEISPNAITIAEDVSGMPGMALPVNDGGLGFDYRLTMGLPDLWFSHIEHFRDEDWDLAHIADQLTQSRPNEKRIAYCECHDQSIVGDRPLAFRLMQDAMYSKMAIASRDESIDRGIAMLNIIRSITFFAGGEGWLNFIGNEFGHPEWVDFPREGNAFSFKRACRKWSLVDNPFLCYQFLANFDEALQFLDEHTGLLSAPPGRALYVSNADTVLAFERKGMMLVANLHPDRSLTDYSLTGVPPGEYRLDLHTDSYDFGGASRLETGQALKTYIAKGDSALKLNIPSRSALFILPVNIPPLGHPYADKYSH